MSNYMRAGVGKRPLDGIHRVKVSIADGYEVDEYRNGVRKQSRVDIGKYNTAIREIFASRSPQIITWRIGQTSGYVANTGDRRECTVDGVEGTREQCENMWQELSRSMMAHGADSGTN